MLGINFNEGQSKAIDLAEDWYFSFVEGKRVNPTFEISGAAGTGKTSIIYGLMERLKLDITKDVKFMALIGQAALVMRMKGLDANTIHGSMYCMYEKIATDVDGKPMFDSQNRPITTTGWTKKSIQEFGRCHLIVVDEGSMVDPKMARDILSYGIPVIVLGDLNQLPPIFGKSAFLTDPDIVLTKIERQSEGHPIIDISCKARNGVHIEKGEYGDNGEVQVIYQSELTDEMLTGVDIVICAKNVTRNNINNRVRRILGYTGNLPNIGERLVFRKNNWKRIIDKVVAITNGLQCCVTSNVDVSNISGKGVFNASVKPVFNSMGTSQFDYVPIDYGYFMQGCKSDKCVERFNEGEKAEFGYSITCHMSQGSQYSSVLVYEEVLSKDIHRKWLYTAVTRAVDKLILVRPDPKSYSSKYSTSKNSYNRRW
ncbi:MAG: ATP-dependent DNA helicase [Fusobacteriaceae bacterium]